MYTVTATSEAEARTQEFGASGATGNTFAFLLLLLSVGIESKASFMLGKCSATEVHHLPWDVFL